MPLRIRKRLSIVELLLLVLTVLTIAIMAWQYWGMNLSLVITPGSTHKVWAMGDSVDNGASKAKLHEDNAYNMECQIRSQIQFPYCSLYIQLGPDHQGLDLTVYQQLLLTIKQTGTVRDSTTLYLKDLKNETDIAALSNQISVNQLSLNPTETFTEYVLPLHRFYVPSWWVYHSRLPHETPGPNLSNINYLVINTGDNHRDREINVSIARIEFKGKWIDADELYKHLLMAWICIFGLFYLVLFTKLQIESSEEKTHRKELEDINIALDNKRKQLESLAIYDSSTGILNRRGIIDKLQDTFLQLKPEENCCIALISIENYKNIDSKFKENTIDDQVSYTADQLLSHLQHEAIMDSDVQLARWGKNELLAIINPANSSAIITTFKQFILKTPGMKFRHTLAIQLSIGIVITESQPIQAAINLFEQAASTARQSLDKIHVITHSTSQSNQ